jgi:hypothetical protein
MLALLVPDVYDGFYRHLLSISSPRFMLMVLKPMALPLTAVLVTGPLVLIRSSAISRFQIRILTASPTVELTHTCACGTTFVLTGHSPFPFAAQPFFQRSSNKSIFLRKSLSYTRYLHNMERPVVWFT